MSSEKAMRAANALQRMGIMANVGGTIWLR